MSRWKMGLLFLAVVLAVFATSYLPEAQARAPNADSQFAFVSEAGQYAEQTMLAIQTTTFTEVAANGTMRAKVIWFTNQTGSQAAPSLKSHVNESGQSIGGVADAAILRRQEFDAKPGYWLII